MTEIILAAMIYAGSFYGLDWTSTRSALDACDRAGVECREVHTSFNTGTTVGAAVATVAFTAADYGVSKIPRYGKWISWGLRVGIFVACMNAYRGNSAIP